MQIKTKYALWQAAKAAVVGIIAHVTRLCLMLAVSSHAAQSAVMHSQCLHIQSDSILPPYEG